MAGLRLFKIELSGISLDGWRNFDAADLPFSLKVDSITWQMTMNEASGLGGAALRLEDRIRWAAEKGERPAAGPIFRRPLTTGSGESAVIELGIAVIEETSAVYFEFAAKRVTLSEADGAILLANLALFRADVADVRRGAAEQ